MKYKTVSVEMSEALRALRESMSYTAMARESDVNVSTLREATLRTWGDRTFIEINNHRKIKSFIERKNNAARVSD